MNKIVSDTNKKHNEHMTAEIRKNYKLNNKEKLSGKTILKSMPVRISVNLTGRCNNKCSYCNLSIPGVEYYTKEEMSFDTFSLLTPFLPTLSYLVYFANAEPLIAKNFKEIYKASSNLPWIILIIAKLPRDLVLSCFISYLLQISSCLL